MENTVFVGLVIAWFLATRPTKRSPDLVKPTTEGVVLAPSELAMTTGSPPSIIAIQELVVPKSIPKTLFVALLILLISFMNSSRFSPSPAVKSDHAAGNRFAALPERFRLGTRSSLLETSLHAYGGQTSRPWP